MKKAIPVFIIIGVIAAFLSGCGALYDENYGDNVSNFIDPYEAPEAEFDILPDGNAESSAGSASGTNTSDNPPTGYGTFDITPKIVGSSLIGNGFEFEIPYPWSESNMQALAVNTNDSGYDISTYIFYYVEADGGRAPMVTIEIVPQQYFYQNLAKDGDNLGESADKEKIYLLMEQNEAMPSDFTDLETYLDIYEKLGTGSYAITIK